MKWCNAPRLSPDLRDAAIKADVRPYTGFIAKYLPNGYCRSTAPNSSGSRSRRFTMPDTGRILEQPGTYAEAALERNPEKAFENENEMD